VKKKKEGFAKKKIIKETDLSKNKIP